jgi:hypothetical protein
MINKIFFAVVGLLVVVIVFSSVKKKKFSEKESFFWMLLSIGMLILAIFPSIIPYITNLVHIEYPPSLLFLIAILFIILIIFRLTEYISTMREQLKDLSQNFALMEERLRIAENITGDDTKK